MLSAPSHRHHHDDDDDEGFDRPQHEGYYGAGHRQRVVALGEVIRRTRGPCAALSPHRRKRDGTDDGRLRWTSTCAGSIR